MTALNHELFLSTSLQCERFAFLDVQPFLLFSSAAFLNKSLTSYIVLNTG